MAEYAGRKGLEPTLDGFEEPQEMNESTDICAYPYVMIVASRGLSL